MSSEAAVSQLGEGDAEGGAPRGHSEPVADHHVNYLLIFYALIVLTVVTVVVALQRFENEWYNVGLALLVASIKALLVARYFMHLKFEGKLIKLTLYFPVLLCVIMVAALVPDIGLARKHGTVFSDTMKSYDVHGTHAPAPGQPHPTPADGK